VYDCFSSTSINKYGNAVRDNKSSFYDHLSPSLAALSEEASSAEQQNGMFVGKQLRAIK
jgi:hypothetical protein